MKLIVVNSNSSGNSYALDSGTEILLLEAGCRMPDVKRAINFRLQDVVGCIVTHEHGDHARYATEYARFGVGVYGNEDIAQKKQFTYGTYHVLKPERSCHIGSFTAVPFLNYHDVPIFGYLVHHPDMGTLLFSTDSYKIGLTITGVTHYLVEANYSDAILKEAVREGKVNKAQADRIMLSHMSLQYTVQYLRDCSVGCGTTATKTITLCHLSERHSNPIHFRQTVEQAFGIPTFIARKGLVVELNKELI